MRSLSLLAALACGITGCGVAAGAPPVTPDAAPGPGASDAASPRSDAATLSDAALRDAEPPDATVEGAKVCVQAAHVRRACAADADCVAVLRVTSCCGSAVWMGIRASAVTSFDTLEAACERSYADCTCGALPSTTDDGSIVDSGAVNDVMASCQGGTCKTFAAACGHPCPSGASCVTCSARGATTATCVSAQTTCGSISSQGPRSSQRPARVILPAEPLAPRGDDP